MKSPPRTLVLALLRIVVFIDRVEKFDDQRSRELSAVLQDHIHYCDASNLWSACTEDVDWIECYCVQVVDVPEEVHCIDTIGAGQHSPDEC